MAATKRRGRLGPHRELARQLFSEAKSGDFASALVLADLLEESGYEEAAKRLRDEMGGYGSLAGRAQLHTRLWHLLERPVAEIAHSPFVVSTTYEITDVDGDEVERGFEEEDEPMTLRELLRHIDVTLGSWHLDSYSSDAARRQYIGIIGNDSPQNYRTGEITRRSIHVRGSPSAILRLAYSEDEEVVT